MDENNKIKPSFSYPNSDRPLDSKETTQGPNALNTGHETVKFKEVMEKKQEQFIYNEAGVPKIETYKTDVARAIKDEKVSALQVAIAEQKKQQDRELAGVAIAKEKSYSLLIKIIFVGLFLMILALGYLWWAGILPLQKTPPTNQNTTTEINQNASSIKIEQRQVILIDEKDSVSIKNSISKAKKENFPSATIKEIILGTQPATASITAINIANLFSKLETNASDQLIRSLGNNYVLGIYGSNPRETFIIFEVKSYDNAFAGMLNWESYIYDDVGSIFERESTQGPVSTSTAKATTQKVFTDKIILNKDTRVLNGPNGQVKMLYSFIDPKTLVIVSSEVGFRELLSRLTTGKITR